MTVVIDSADVLCSDLESPSKSYALIAALLSTISARPSKHSLLLSVPQFNSKNFLFLPIRALPSRPTLLRSLPPTRPHPDPTSLPYDRAHRRTSPRAPGAPRDRTAHAPAARERPRSLLAHLCAAQRPHVGGRADRSGRGRRRGNRPGGAHACARRTGSKFRKGVGRVGRRWPVFVV